MFKILTFILLLGCAFAAPAREITPDNSDAPRTIIQSDSDDLKGEASTTYGRRYSEWSGYPGTGYNSQVTGYGLLDDRYSPYNNGVYDNIGYKGYDRGYYTGINNYSGYGGYKGNAGYDSSGINGYGQNAFGGNGGYGGYGGNGGINSYYGYNNPYYQGAQHLGYGYNNKLGYGNIYGGITPSLVTGYRGYSRR